MALAWRRCFVVGRRRPSLAGYSTLKGAAQAQRRGAPRETLAERLAQQETIYGTTQRTEKMEPNQDWTSVYPTAASFKPSAVPLPVRMGYPIKGGVSPAKEGNLELLKIPNFLHLTPVAIQKHCAALKDFCTEWPSALNSDEKCLQHFPIEISTTDYVSAGPSLHNPKARVVTLKVKLSSINLDDHAKKKFIKLKTEQWEKEITEMDREEYVWENSASEKNALRTLLQVRAAEKAEEIGRRELLALEVIQDYKKSMVLLKNEGETEKNLLEYKNSVKRLLNMHAL